MRWLLFWLLPLSALAQLRIDDSGFRVPEREIQIALTAVIETFPPFHSPPIHVSHSPKGPITLFEKNLQGETTVHLNTTGRYWAQYIYQFSHELTHIYARFRPDGRENKWLEETLCETASLYTLRSLSAEWKTHPPHPAWKDYHPKLAEYAQNIIDSRPPLTLKELPAFYQKHRLTLRKNEKERILNGSMATALLPIFESNPSHWQSLRSLNLTPRPPGCTLRQHFQSWLLDSPEKHRPFIRMLHSLFLPKSSLSESLEK